MHSALKTTTKQKNLTFILVFGFSSEAQLFQCITHQHLTSAKGFNNVESMSTVGNRYEVVVSSVIQNLPNFTLLLKISVTTDDANFLRDFLK